MPSAQLVWDLFQSWPMPESASPQVLGLWKERTKPPAGIGVVVDRPPVGARGQSVAPAEGAEVVVEAVVLHHEHHDVLDLGEGVGAGRKVGVGEGAGREDGAARPEPGGRGGVGLGPHRGAETRRGHPGGGGPGQQGPPADPGPGARSLRDVGVVLTRATIPGGGG